MLNKAIRSPGQTDLDSASLRFHQIVCVVLSPNHPVGPVESQRIDRLSGEPPSPRCNVGWLHQVDKDSVLWQDMKETNTEFILLNLTFPDNFPFSPPFMRVLSPRLENGYVLDGGAICMELLTPRGWSSAYTVEAVMRQFAASLVKGQGRICRKAGKSKKSFSRKEAEATFKSLVKTHEKYGWVTPPVSDG
uniref:Ubiquitin-conjugating enzyme E2Q-like protein 1 n=1 Tax=Mus spicilegus TaxID=10103 RepID=A0A8C6HFT6_MUSSI